ncbi:MAG: hypothetical protein ACOCXG_04650, partial [Nanoarchaeota archaeon]
MYDIILGRTQSDQKKYGKKGTVMIGKQYVQMGQNFSLSNPIYMDVSRAHAMLICGKRGGGKCLNFSSKIKLANETEIEIGKIFENFKKDNLVVKRNDNVEEYTCDEEILIKTFNEKTNKIENKKITNVYRRKTKENLIEWEFETLEKNKRLITTKDHKLLTCIDFDYINEKEEFEWISKKDNKFFQYHVGYDSNNKKYARFQAINNKEIKFEGYVYDISVENNHNFIANDVIVHNSYTMGSIAEGLADMDPEIAKNLAFMMLDTMGVYWSMKYPNNKEEALLKKWGLEGKGLGVQIYVPGGFFEKYKEDGVPVDFPFFIQPRELQIEDWMNAFKLHTDDAVGVAVQRVVNSLLVREKNFDLDDVIKETEEDSRLDEKTKLAVISRFENAKT